MIGILCGVKFSSAHGISCTHYGSCAKQFKLHKMSGRSIIGRKVRRELEEEQEDGSIVTEILNGVVSSYR
eukprot:1472753-Pyramimonas_sp.AAC.2